MAKAAQVELRDLVYDYIAAYITTNLLDVTFQKTYFPNIVREEMGTKPWIFIVACNFSSPRFDTNGRNRLTRDKSLEVEIPLQLAVLQSLDKTDIAGQDAILLLTEQIMALCEDDFLSADNKSFTWARTEPLRETPQDQIGYSYEQMTRDGVFNCPFNVFYKHVKTAGQ